MIDLTRTNVGDFVAVADQVMNSRWFGWQIHKDHMERYILVRLSESSPARMVGCFTSTAAGLAVVYNPVFSPNCTWGEEVLCRGDRSREIRARLEHLVRGRWL